MFIRVNNFSHDNSFSSLRTQAESMGLQGEEIAKYVIMQQNIGREDRAKERELQQAKIEADKAKIEADKAKIEADKDKARVEAEREKVKLDHDLNLARLQHPS